MKNPPTHKYRCCRFDRDKKNPVDANHNCVENPFNRFGSWARLDKLHSFAIYVRRKALGALSSAIEKAIRDGLEVGHVLLVGAVAAISLRARFMDAH